MDMYAITAEHPLLGILRNVPLEKTIDYADAAVRGGVAFFEVALNSPHAARPSPPSAAAPQWTPVPSSC